ncbi:MAG: Rab family GTPase [Vicinamibacterales bacterium]
MIQKKVCLLGAFATGKTSLVARFVRSVFSEKYLTTVGVMIERKTVATNAGDVNLILWDLHGEDEFQKVRASYLRGTAGLLFVVDGTRRDTLERALLLYEESRIAIGPVPGVFALSKCDLVDAWELTDDDLRRLETAGCTWIRTSAKTGEGVELAFARLVAGMVGHD